MQASRSVGAAPSMATPGAGEPGRGKRRIRQFGLPSAFTVRHSLPVQGDSATLDPMDGQRGAPALVGARLAAAPLLLMLAACSFASVRPTPQVAPLTGQGRCAEVELPAADAVAAGIGVGVTLGLSYLDSLGSALCDSSPGNPPCSRPAAGPAVGALIVTGVLAASSIYGFTARGICQQRLADADRVKSELPLDAALQEKRPIPTANVEPIPIPAPAR